MLSAIMLTASCIACLTSEVYHEGEGFRVFSGSEDSNIFHYLYFPHIMKLSVRGQSLVIIATNEKRKHNK